MSAVDRSLFLVLLFWSRTGMLDADIMTPSRLVAIALAFGLGFAVVGSATLHASGGHLNPAISFAMVVSGRLTLVAGICYTVAQSIGAIVGVFCVSAAFPNEYHVSRVLTLNVTHTRIPTNMYQTGRGLKECIENRYPMFINGGLLLHRDWSLHAFRCHHRQSADDLD